MLNEVYGSAAPLKSGPIEGEFLSDEELRRDMTEICRRFPEERAALREAYEALKRVEHRTHLAVRFAQPDLLQTEDAREYLQKAIDEKSKLTESDKEALTRLDNEVLVMTYDMVKFTCDTTEKHFAKLEKLLSYAQSEMKLV